MPQVRFPKSAVFFETPRINIVLSTSCACYDSCLSVVFSNLNPIFQAATSKPEFAAPQKEENWGGDEVRLPTYFSVKLHLSH